MVPENAEVIGNVSVMDGGFTTHCDWETVLETAKQEVRAAGGNGIEIVQHRPYVASEPLKVGEGVPQCTLESIDGTRVSLADLRGKIVLIDFLYKSCGPCIAAMPGLQRLHEKYQGKGFAMVGIDPYDNPEDVSELLNKRGISYTILFSDKELPGEYHVDGYPNLFLIDREGKLVKLYLGYRQDLEDWIEEEIVKLL